jgi:hypothetical protein
MTNTQIAEIADRMLGRPRKTTWAPRRIAALLKFPSDMSPIRATAHIHYADFRRLRDDGLIEGVAGDANLSPFGQAVAAYLKEQRNAD